MSNEKTSTSRTGGIGFLGMLTILFIGLKLTNYIDWSWFWVLSPVLLPLLVVGGIALTILVVAIIMAPFSK